MPGKRKYERCSIEEVRRLLRYEPETGKLFWRVAVGGGNRGKRVPAGKEAGTARQTKSGGYAHTWYKSLNIDEIRYPATHIIWALMYGKWPEGTIDHINLDTLDDRLVNLRDATPREQMLNQTRSRKRQIGADFKDVRKIGLKYRWRLQVDGNLMWSRETFVTVEAAQTDLDMRLQDLNGAAGQNSPGGGGHSKAAGQPRGQGSAVYDSG